MSPVYVEEVPVMEQMTMTSQERNWGMLCHLAALAGFLIPLGNVLGPLVIWLIKKEQFAFVNDQGKEALNFQITMLICGIVSGILMLVLIGIILLIAVAVLSLVFTIIAAVQASKGVSYRYPFALRLVK